MTPAELDDDQLMIEIQSGNQAAFERLLERHEGSLLGFFIRNTKDHQLAEDLTQETLLRVYHRSWDYLPLGRFRSWMFRIARNLLIDTVRRQSSDALIRAYTGQAEDESNSLARLVGEIVSPNEQAQQRELTDIVDELLQQIPEEQRTTFVMHHYSGLSLPEVAEATETSVPTCKSRLRLAREKLRGLLAGRGIADAVKRGDESV